MRFTTIMNVYAFLFSLLFAFSAVAAPLPESVDKRDVYVPPITYPKAGTVWRSGETHTVKWDASDPPAQITNPRGRIMLRKGDLTTPLVLANDFDILSGQIHVKIPLLVEGNDYALVLFGDSGNFSPQFTIKSGIPY